MDLEEIFNIDPVVLEQLLEQPLQEEPPQHNLVDVDSQTISRNWKENCGKTCVTKFIEYLRAATRIRIFHISEAIKNLPLEIHELIYKEFIAIKLRERKEMGWDEVHFAIEEAPFCEKRLRIVNGFFCYKSDGSCRRNGICFVCYKNGVKHYPNLER